MKLNNNCVLIEYPFMLRKLSYLANKNKIADIRRNLTEKKDTFSNNARRLKTKAQSSSWYAKLKKYWRYAPIPISLYLLWVFINRNYSTKWKCIKKLDSIYNESNRDRLKINFNYKFIEYFFPTEPLAIIFPQSEEELEKVVQLCSQYNVAMFVSPTKEFSQPSNLEDHKHYIIVNLTLLRNFSVDVENSTMRLSTGLKCGEINKILAQNGYAALFDQELEEKHLFEVINYNLPLKTKNLSSILINLELVSGNGKLFQSGPDIQHYGPNVRYNDIFLGSKGIFGIPIKAFIRLEREQQAQEKKTVELSVGNPNDKILIVRDIIKKLSYRNIKLRVYCQEGRTILEMSNYGSPCLDEILQKYPLKLLTEEVKQPEYVAIFNIPLTFLYEMMVNAEYSNVNFQFQKGLLKISTSESLVKQLNNRLTIQNGLLIWIRDSVMFQQLKKQNAGIELGENLIYQNLNLREFFDPKHTLLSTKSYLNFVKRPTRYTFRSIISDFW